MWKIECLNLGNSIIKQRKCWIIWKRKRKLKWKNDGGINKWWEKPKRGKRGIRSVSWNDFSKERRISDWERKVWGIANWEIGLGITNQIGWGS